MSLDVIESLVRKHGATAKLKHAIVAALGWRRADPRSGDEGEWYARWPELAPVLNTAMGRV